MLKDKSIIKYYNMPFKESNYANSLIYKLCCKDPNIEEIYVGSTTNFKQRKASHKTICNNENNKKHNYKVYQFIRDNGGWDNWNMIQIEPYSCETKRELEKREEELRKELKANLNSNNCCLENYNMKDYMKEYNENRKDKKKEYNIKYQQENKEKIKERRKKFYEENKEKLKETQKKYYEERTKKHQSFILENN